LFFPICRGMLKCPLVCWWFFCFFALFSPVLSFGPLSAFPGENGQLAEVNKFRLPCPERPGPWSGF
jgi:hypothetical protein